jgi:hypothetical protein
MSMGQGRREEEFFAYDRIAPAPDHSGMMDFAPLIRLRFFRSPRDPSPAIKTTPIISHLGAYRADMR